MLLALFPRPHHTVYADPIVSPFNVQKVAQLKTPSLSHVEPAEPIYINKLRDYGTYANSYTPGQCTWYTASRLPVPQNWGNAITWGYYAAADGYTVSPIPKVGSVAWSATDSYLGHVAVVVAVNGNQVTIDEMNFNGPYSVDERLANPGEFQYIYV